ncbi:GMC oxidoreductase-domain-containing protein [Armillaria borealis]|uniref:GMC oxidoreductase-domain-containing protein n=1 Tax=Armillaria borealis TaxID=47425 RepID=A0AA39MG92_9AGAR|nr:GMC oxidoreductase-domain-containing protein [Armillaria borealis]
MQGYPASRGQLHITSDDIYAHPDFDSGFLSHPADVAALRWGYKKGRELIRRLGVYRGPLAPAHPQFAAGSAAAAALAENGPVALDAPKITYSKEDDEAISANVRNFVATTWHSLGTCPMKPREQGGVINNDLNVYGTTGLKIADFSIAPANVNCRRLLSQRILEFTPKKIKFPESFRPPETNHETRRDRVGTGRIAIYGILLVSGLVSEHQKLSRNFTIFGVIKGV